MWPFSSTAYLPIVQAKQAERERLVDEELARTVLVDGTEAAKIIKATASEIVQQIQREIWTASQVLDAYIARAAYAHSITNCLTEVMFRDAHEHAKALDVEFAATKKLRGPLHGVPLSVKDQYDVAGYATSIGFSSWASTKAQKHATLVAQLIAAGAIPLAKTNVPQTMFAFECNNPVWGRTTNPYNDQYTSGGSSGGEGAILAMDGSAFGIGSDIGGSLRIPAAYCGIYSLKPSEKRISYRGTHGPVPGFEGIISVGGPMARSIDDLELFCRTIYGQPDPVLNHLVPLPYREVKLPERLQFGYYTFSGIAKASPAVERAVITAVEALRSAGHTCTEFVPPSSVEALEIFLGLSSSDAYRTMTSHVGSDPLDPTLWLTTIGARLPGPIRRLVAWVTEKLVGDSAFASFIRAAHAKPFGEYLKYTDKRNKFVERFYEDVWHKHQFDGIIAPVQALPQLPNGGGKEVTALAAETILYNVVPSPVGVVPVTRIDAEKDVLTPAWTSGAYLGSPVLEKRCYRQAKPWYDAKTSHSMPVGIQIVGRAWEDEKVLAMMKVVDRALGLKRGFGPGSWETKTVSIQPE